MTRRSVALVISICLVLSSQHATGVHWRPDSTCSTGCSTDHTCVTCRTDVVGDCADGEVADPLAQREEVDEASCMQTECSTGGCPPERPYQKSAEVCFNTHFNECKSGVCMRETCCSRHAVNRCCKEVPCIQEFADCLAPEQLSSNSSSSAVNSTRLPHGAKGIFPFYTNATVLAGQVCEKVWGRCSCNDGQLVPGCDATNSSTWTTLDSDAQLLPPGLHQTCSSLEGCRMPHQDVHNDPSNSSITYVAVQHGATATFPFYSAALVPAGSPCEQVLGSCTCNNGSLAPGGCDPSDSSTWGAVINGTAAAAPLPTGLSLTCSTNATDAGQQLHSRLSGAQVAGIVLGSAAVAALLVGAVAWYLRSRLGLKRWAQLRTGSSYQPVLTGAASERPAATASAFGTMGDALAKFRSGVGLGRKARDGRAGGHVLPGTGSGPLAVPRHLPYPASTDDEVFTLDDLDSNHHDHYPTLPVSRRAEVELHAPSTSYGHSSRHPAHRGGAAESAEATDKQPLLSAPAVPSTPPHPTGSQAAHAGSTAAMRQLRLTEEEEEEADEESGPLVGGGGRHRRR